MIRVGRFLPAGYSEIQPWVFITYNVPLPSMQAPVGRATPIVICLSGLGLFAEALYTKTVLEVYSVTNRRCGDVSVGPMNVACDPTPWLSIGNCEPPQSASNANDTQKLSAPIKPRFKRVRLRVSLVEGSTFDGG